MPTGYIDEALRRARYEPIDDEETPCYGEAPELPGVWACGRTLEGRRRELKDVVEGWILVSVRQSPGTPAPGGLEITETGAPRRNRRQGARYPEDDPGCRQPDLPGGQFPVRAPARAARGPMGPAR